jgi:ubiquinone/menaquinone biosynthesis C-methylase UbiE
MDKKRIQRIYDHECNSYLINRPWLNYYIRRRVAGLVEPWLKLFKRDQTIMHAGIGFGWLEESLSYAPVDLNYIGVDLSAKMAHSTKKRLPWIDMVIADAEALPFRIGSLDAIIINRLIKFLESHRVFGEANRTVKDGGAIAVIFDCDDTVHERFFKRIQRPYDITQRSAVLMYRLSEQNFQTIICAPATWFPLHPSVRALWCVPYPIYRLLGLFDNIMKHGRITVIFGLKRKCRQGKPASLLLNCSD